MIMGRKMTYKNKTYICFDGDSDIHYYYLMKAWKSSDSNSFNFYDAHDINTARDSSSEETIKRRLRERLSSTKLMTVLIGENTKNLYRFVRWEMEQALSLGIPIIGINLNGHTDLDAQRCPSIIKNELVLHVPFKQKAVEWAIDNWITTCKQYQKGPVRLSDNFLAKM
jgi:hypothetical protein